AALGPLRRRAACVDPWRARAQAERQRVRQREPTGMGGAVEQLLARRPLRVQPGVSRLTPQTVTRGARLELEALRAPVVDVAVGEERDARGVAQRTRLDEVREAAVERLRPQVEPGPRPLHAPGHV